MEFRILGPLEVVDGGRVVAVGGSKQRALLATLLLHANRVVSTERLIDELWGDRPPETASNALQVYVSRLRKAIGGDVVAHRGTGYVAQVARGDLDLARFEDLVAEARTLPAAQAAERLGEALSLWRGEPEVDAARLEELRTNAVDDRIDAELALGRHADAIAELQALVAAEPLRERSRAQLMLAFYRAGRQADALAEFARARETLVEELGVEPGPELQRLQRAILAQDADLAAPTAPAAPASRLPAPPTALVGRERELAEAAALLRNDARLVTLTGPGGIGKTRLALELARGLEPDFGDGAALVRLATVDDPALVPAAVAQAVGVPEADADALREHLRPRSLLVVLDNFEQLLPAAPFLSELLEAAAGLRLLVTSRAVLHVAGEHEYPVPPLDEAEELFVARARAVDPSFAPDVAVAAICARLEGLPLAIELAAARVKLLPPAAILERLEHSLDLLTGVRADAPAHQQTLRAAIEWSYRLLEERERLLFTHLAVFPGGATLDAIETVAGGDLDTLASLVDKSLLRRSGERFAMLELLREFAAEQLADGEELRRAHLAYYLELTERAYSETSSGMNEAEWLDRLEDEHPNIRAALAFAVGNGDTDAALRAAASLTRFWQIHGHLVEGRKHFETVLALPGDAPPVARQRVLNGLGILAAEQGDFAAAEEAFTTALALARALGDDERTATAMGNLANMYLFREEYDEARRLLEEALELQRGGRQIRANAVWIENLGVVAFCEGDLETAERRLREAHGLALELGDRREIGSSLRMLARVRLALGDTDDASLVLAESVAAARSVGDKHGLADALETAAAIATSRGREPVAAELFGAAEALRETIGAYRQPDTARWYAEARARAKQGLEEDEFVQAFQRGRGLEPDDALALAGAS